MGSTLTEIAPSSQKIDRELIHSDNLTENTSSQNCLYFYVDVPQGEGACDGSGVGCCILYHFWCI